MTTVAPPDGPPPSDAFGPTPRRGRPGAWRDGPLVKARVPSVLLVPLALLAALAGTPADGRADPLAPATTDRAALEARYAAGFEALVRGELAAAAAQLDEVARRTDDPERRAAARELARLARALIARSAGAGSAGSSVASRAEDDRPSAGRIELVAATTLASAYAGVVLVVDLLDLDDFRAEAAVVTAATGVGFATSLLVGRSRAVTGGMAEAYTSGLFIGAANGLLLAGPLGIDPADRGYLSVGLGGMAVGGAGGLLLAARSRPTRAQVTFTTTMSAMGFASVGLGLAIAQPDLSSDALTTALAAGLDAGAAAGLLLAPRIEWSKGRARLVALGAFLGGLSGFGATAIAIGSPDGDAEGRVLAGAVLAGAWAGLGLTARLTRGMAPDPRFVAGPASGATARDLAAATVLVPAPLPGGATVSLGGAF